MNEINLSYIWVSVLLMSLITYIPRVTPFIFLQKRALPEWFNDWLTFVPPAVFGALIFPDILMQEGRISLSWDNLALWASVVTFPAAYFTRSLTVSILVGAGAYALLMYVG